MNPSVFRSDEIIKCRKENDKTDLTSFNKQIVFHDGSLQAVCSFLALKHPIFVNNMT